jgi:hypothetical protein
MKKIVTSTVRRFVVLFILAFMSPILSWPQIRQLRYGHGTPAAAVKWQREVRNELSRILHLQDLPDQRAALPLQPHVISLQDSGMYQLQEVEILSTSKRRIPLLLTRPKQGNGPFPAVVCVHGHGGTRWIVYKAGSIYKGFAGCLAARGYVTIAADVGQHQVYEAGRILMGERLWDLLRCVDYLCSLDFVDAGRIGCAGLSLGGEMTMWLGAMDERIRATLSAGFLTRMEQMEKNHCQCWKFDGLRERVDYADIYSLIAPRALMCQNGLKEPAQDFTVELAQQAMAEIQAIYQDMGSQHSAILQVHPGAHEIDLPSLQRFFDQRLR